MQSDLEKFDLFPQAGPCRGHPKLPFSSPGPGRTLVPHAPARSFARTHATATEIEYTVGLAPLTSNTCTKRVPKLNPSDQHTSKADDALRQGVSTKVMGSSRGRNIFVGFCFART